MAISFVGPGTRLADIDLPRIGHLIGVGEDEIHAFLEVETRGGGFDSKGRVKQLFEPHIFYKHLSGASRDRAVRQLLAYPKWRAGNYPADSYPRLTDAMAIDEIAALKACSWGIGQVLGENFADAGYSSVQQMVTAFVEGGEPEQLAAAVRFIKANHLDDELRSHNWAAFARGYNGPGYAANDYHNKLAKAYAKWSVIRDTPWAPPPVVETMRMAVNATENKPTIVTAVQPSKPIPVAAIGDAPKPTPVVIITPSTPIAPPVILPRFVGWREGLSRFFGV